MLNWKRSSLITILFTFFSVSVIMAQGTCAPLVERALEAVDRNCTDLDRNNACYGFDLVRASFASEVPDDYFVEPADTSNLLDLETITTAGLDEVNGIWGVAVMNIQANLPDTLPGQNVTFVLMGDAEVENAVAVDVAFIAPTSIAVTVAQESNVRTGPGLNFNVLRTVSPGATIPADGMNSEGDWVRVVVDDRIGWMSRSILIADPALDDLPRLTPELRSPMQAFYLRTGIGTSGCQAAPDDMLLVQGPEEIEIDLTVNGASFRVGSTVGMRLLAEDLMELVVLDGKVQMLDDNFEPTGVVVRAGQRTTACLSEPDNRGSDGEANDRIVECDFSPPEWIDESSIAGDWCVLQQIPSNLLNYPVDLFCPGEMLPTPIPPTPVPAPIVQQPAPVVVVAETEVPVETNDCSGFGIIGPLSGITPRPTVFSWTQAPGADNYELVFYNYQGAQAQSFFTSQTSIQVNVGQVPTGSELWYEVRAYVQGNYLCVTPRSPKIFRLADPQAPLPQVSPVPGSSSSFTASMISCRVATGPSTGTMVVQARQSLPTATAAIGWSGAQASDSISATGTDFLGNSVTGSGSGSSGTLIMSGWNSISNIVVTTSSGSSASVGTCS